MTDLPQKPTIGAGEAWDAVRTRLVAFFIKLDAWIRGQPRWMSKEIEFREGTTNQAVFTGIADPVQGVWVEHVQVANADTFPTAAVHVNWSVGDRGIVIRSIIGLTSGTLNKIRLLFRW